MDAELENDLLVGARAFPDRQLAHAVNHQFGNAAIGETSGQRARDAEARIDLAQQQSAAIGAELADLLAGVCVANPARLTFFKAGAGAGVGAD